jgi:hypothetical protein
MMFSARPAPMAAQAITAQSVLKCFKQDKLVKFSVVSLKGLGAKTN